MIRRSVPNATYGHSLRKIGRGQYRMSWTSDRKVGGSRLRYPTTSTRDTDLEGAIRFTKKWGLSSPQEPVSAGTTT